MITFLRIEILYWGMILPAVAVLLAVWSEVRSYRARRRFASEPLPAGLLKDYSLKRRLWRYSFQILAALMLLVALSDPVSQRREADGAGSGGAKGIDVVFSIDVSNSMRATDLPPNRLLFAKQVTEACINRLEGSRVGLVVFAGGAYIRMPLSSDRGTARALLADLDYDLLSNQGTDLYGAIDLAHTTLGKERKPYGRAIVLLTDGENHEGKPREAASEAQDDGITLFTVPVGSTAGAQIPMPDGSVLLDEAGNPVITKTNPELCRALAQEAGGESFSATSAKEVTSQIMKALAALPGTTFGTAGDELNHLFAGPLTLSLIFLLLSELVVLRKSRIFTRLKIFDR